MKKLHLILIVVTLVTACSTKNQTTETAKSVDSTVAVSSASITVGGDRDEHGCIGSAGYRWSGLKNKCLRTFEEADAKLSPTQDTATYTAEAALIFNDDQSKVELYLPNQLGSILLRRTGEEGNYIWKNDSLELFSWKGYALRKNGSVIFQGE